MQGTDCFGRPAGNHDTCNRHYDNCKKHQRALKKVGAANRKVTAGKSVENYNARCNKQRRNVGNIKNCGEKAAARNETGRGIN